MKTLVATFALAAIAGAAIASQSTISPASNGYLSTHFGIAAREVMALNSGRAIVRTSSASDSREIVSLGAIVIGASPGAYIDRLRDIADFKKGGSVLQIGVFSWPPTEADTESLRLPESDKRELSRCRPGRCKVQLPADAIERIVANVRRTADETDRVFRRELTGMVAAYLTVGPGGLPVYADTSSPTNTAEEFRRLVQSEPAILRRFGGLYRHFEVFPQTDAAIEDQIYWSKEKLGPAEVVSVTHLAIQKMDDSLAPVKFVAASRQLYSTHYFDASLGLTILLADPAEPRQSILVYVNRTRADVFGGMLGRLRRSLVASRLRSTMEHSLIAARGLVEGGVDRPSLAMQRHDQN